MAVRDFKSTDDGEWYVENGDFATVADEDAVPQGIRIRASMFLGEAYLNQSVGIDYIDKVLIKNPDELLVRAIIGAAISKTPDVTNVVGAQLVDEGDRNASISYAVETVYSDETLTGQVEVP